MKKVYLLLVCAMLLLSACSVSAEGYSQSDLSLYDTETNKEIHLGMTKEEIEDALGEPLEKTDHFPYYDAPGISIGFRDGISVLFALKKVEESEGENDSEEDVAGRFKTSRGITVNSSYEDFQKKYPASIRQQNSYQLTLLREDSKYEDITQSFFDDKKPYQESFHSVYQIHFGNYSTEPKASPSYIYIGDFSAIHMAQVEK